MGCPIMWCCPLPLVWCLESFGLIDVAEMTGRNGTTVAFGDRSVWRSVLGLSADVECVPSIRINRIPTRPCPAEAGHVLLVGRGASSRNRIDVSIRQRLVVLALIELGYEPQHLVGGVAGPEGVE